MSTETKTLPITEIFGPVIQGEGRLCGSPTFFVRLGGCDYRCSWCDTLYSVLPERVKEEAIRMTASDIIHHLITLGVSENDMVTLSGGNPCIHDLTELVNTLISGNLVIAVETQGSQCPSWLSLVDYVTVSPKPPSAISNSTSSFDTFLRWLETFRHLEFSNGAPNLNVKIVVDNSDDYNFACRAILATQELLGLEFDVQYHLQPCTPQDNLDENLATTRERIHASWDRLNSWVLNTPSLRTIVSVIPQLHTLQYGHRRGI